MAKYKMVIETKFGMPTLEVEYGEWVHGPKLPIDSAERWVQHFVGCRWFQRMIVLEDDRAIASIVLEAPKVTISIGDV